MAPFAFRKGESHLAMTAAAIFTIQNFKHAKLGCASLVFEYLLVTIAANHPFGMLLVRKLHLVHLAGIGKQDIQVEHLYPSI